VSGYTIRGCEEGIGKHGPTTPSKVNRFLLTANQEENRAAPSIAASMTTELSEKSTPEAIFMAKALPSNIYAGMIFSILQLRLLRLPVAHLREYRYGLIYTFGPSFDVTPFL
jgi:hypothetical protein